MVSRKGRIKRIGHDYLTVLFFGCGLFDTKKPNVEPETLWKKYAASFLDHTSEPSILDHTFLFDFVDLDLSTDLAATVYAEDGHDW